MLFVSTALSGWAAALLLGVSISIPYLARSLRWSNLTPHFVLGFLIPAVSFVHASLPVVALHRFDSRGLLLATIALLVMIFQAGLGISLQKATGAKSRRVRRAHFGTMAVIVALIAGHIAVNRA